MTIIAMIDRLQFFFSINDIIVNTIKSQRIDTKYYQLSQNCHNLHVAIIYYLYLSKGIGTEVI